MKNQKTIEKNKEEFSKADIHQILLGSLLGDMYLRKEAKNACLEETHSMQQKDYLIWKDKILSTNFSTKIYSLNNTSCNANGKTYKRQRGVRLRSRVSEKLTYYHQMFYSKGKKRLNNNILGELNKLALAVWYCDDGHYDPSNKTVQIHTEGFSIAENKLLQGWFHNKWKLTSNFKKSPCKEKVLLRFTVDSTNIFLDLIKQHIFQMPPSIWYKLGHIWGGNQSKLNKARLNKAKRTKIYQSKKEVKKRKAEQARKHYSKNKIKILKAKSEYRKTKKYKDYLMEYYQRPHVKRNVSQKQKIYRQKPEYKKKALIYQREYRKRPEVMEKIKEYNKKAREKRKKGDQN